MDDRGASPGPPVLEPDLAIVDPHHHLWDRGGHRYLADELRADLDCGHRIEATVYVECRSAYLDAGREDLRPVGETRFVLDNCQRPLPTARGPVDAAAGIVAFADLTLGDEVDRVLDAHEAAAAGRLRGVRHAVAWHEGSAIRSHYPTGPHMLSDPAFRAGIRRLGARGLTFDVWAYFTQLDDLDDALAACPDTTFVLNHCGGLIGIGPWQDRREDVLDRWRPAIERLAGHDNLVVKLGGLGMPLAGFGFHKRETAPGHAELAAAWRPAIDHCIDSFGADRCMFESNWPVDATAGSYGTVWNAFKGIAAGRPLPEREALFAGTARRVYRLG
ncbi:amidohydrolase family protein [Croceicoccus sp. BE223]|uniref:amidohydrolase family protein n=1 Tax=Croceicoccus sp. BE223 TaxID=2817716 RepID=UPI00285690D8|nr:amidohydrolase family protein [Croceicoccus sp. BE223]MDR7101092.1 putative TIM-barrel fold metal-dependent hydrolase [Croceicoccus sp. BE223]